jgi:hypothetical protein
MHILTDFLLFSPALPGFIRFPPPASLHLHGIRLREKQRRTKIGTALF